MAANDWSLKGNVTNLVSLHDHQIAGGIFWVLSLEQWGTEGMILLIVLRLLSQIRHPLLYSSMKLSLGKMSGNLELSLAVEERLTSWDCEIWCFPEVNSIITKQNCRVPIDVHQIEKYLVWENLTHLEPDMKYQEEVWLNRMKKKITGKGGESAWICLGLLACKMASGLDPFTISLQMKALGVVVIFSHGKSPAFILPVPRK